MMEPKNHQNRKTYFFCFRMDDNENNNPNPAKRGKYYEWNETSMKLAIEAVRAKQIGINAAARFYGVMVDFIL